MYVLYIIYIYIFHIGMPLSYFHSQALFQKKIKDFLQSNEKNTDSNTGAYLLGQVNLISRKSGKYIMWPLVCRHFVL